LEGVVSLGMATNVPLSQQFPSIEEQCQCGRARRFVHCPSCGSAQIRATPRRNHEVLQKDGSFRLVKAFTCRKCGLFFNDDDWQLRCQAPAPRGHQKREELRDKRPDEVLTQEAIASAQQANINYDTSMPESKRLDALNDLIARLRR